MKPAHGTGAAIRTNLAYVPKANPTKLNHGSSGPGSINHFATEMFSDAADIKLTHAPYKGMGPANTDLLGGQIHDAGNMTLTCERCTRLAAHGGATCALVAAKSAAGVTRLFNR